MKIAGLVGAVVVMAGVAAGARAQVVDAPVAQAAKAGWEYGAFFQGGVGLEERSNFSFLMAGGHAGKVLSSEMGTGMLKGDFEYAVEVIPYWQSFTP